MFQYLLATLIFCTACLTALGADAGPTSRPAVVREANRVFIQNMPVLKWGQSGENTWCGAMSAVIKTLGSDVKYAQLMGESSLAFRVRWFKGNGSVIEKKWCPSSPVGEMIPWFDRVLASAGWKSHHICQMEGNYNMDQHRAEVVASIDKGIAVLGYSNTLDVSIFYGYEDNGEKFLVRDYFKGDADTTIALKDSKGMLIFLDQPQQRAADRELATAALKNAVAEWKSAPTGQGKTGAYHMGDDAWAKWIDDIKSSDQLGEADAKQLFFVSWWNYECTDDARQSATAYLYSIQPLFDEKINAHLSAAAQAYFKMTMADVKALYQDKNAFLGPWTGKSIKDWTPEVKAREIELLQNARACDAQAMKEIEAAIKLIAGDQ